MALRMHPVSASRWEQLAATRQAGTPASIDLTGRSEERAAERGRRYQGELALIQAYIDALRPQPVSAGR